MRNSRIFHGKSLIGRFVGIAAALLVALSFAPQAQSQPCTNLCDGLSNWIGPDRHLVEFSQGCYVEVTYYYRQCGTPPDHTIELYIESIELITKCNECETAFLADGISGLLNEAISYALGNGNPIPLNAGGDVTVSWPKCWQVSGGDTWVGCGEPPCCEREILNWIPGTTTGTSTSDPQNCGAGCTTVCQ